MILFRVLLLLFFIASKVLSQNMIEMDLFESISIPNGWEDSFVDILKNGDKPKRKTAVMDFDGLDKLKVILNINVADQFVSSLSKVKTFELLERNKVEKIIQEQNLQLSGLIDEKTIVDVGNLLGAEFILLGSISGANETKVDKFAYELMQIQVNIDGKLVNTSSGKIVQSESGIGTIEEKIFTTSTGELISGNSDFNILYTQAIKIALDDLAKKFMLSALVCGYVLEVNQQHCTIELGENDGVHKDMVFLVLRVGDSIVHPVTKKHLAYKKEIVTAIIAKNVEKNITVCQNYVRGNHRSILPGDIVLKISSEHIK